jgi:hypothetical protein
MTWEEVEYIAQIMELTPAQIAQAKAEGITDPDTALIALRRIEKNSRLSSMTDGEKADMIMGLYHDIGQKYSNDRLIGDLLAKLLSRVANGSEGALKTTVEQLGFGHRTLQQSLFASLIMPMIEQAARNFDTRNFDHRNEASCRTAKTMIEALTHPGESYIRPAIPFI